jgi:hypothetical protein
VRLVDLAGGNASETNCLLQSLMSFDDQDR